MIVERKQEEDMYKMISIRLEEALKEDRKYFASCYNLSPAYVFDNVTLEQLVKNIPTTKEAMLRISGIKEFVQSYISFAFGLQPERADSNICQPS